MKAKERTRKSKRMGELAAQVAEKLGTKCFRTKIRESVAEFRGGSETLPSVPSKGKSGRPSKGEVHKISLAIPVELYEGVKFASYFFRGNITAYINNLIRRDLERNLDKYREFKTMMEEMNRNL